MQELRLMDQIQEFIIVDTGGGVLPKLKKIPFKESRIKDVASCLSSKDKTKTLDDMEATISKRARSKYK